MVEIPEPINPVESKSIHYKEGYKYQLSRDLWLNTGITGYYAETDYVILFRSGWMLIKKGYAWDGASGPTIDTKSSMRCSAGHDALYQLMQLGLIPRELQPIADKLLERIGNDDGMWKVRSHIWERILSKFGRPNTKPAAYRQELVAP